MDTFASSIAGNDNLLLISHRFHCLITSAVACRMSSNAVAITYPSALSRRFRRTLGQSDRHSHCHNRRQLPNSCSKWIQFRSDILNMVGVCVYVWCMRWRVVCVARSSINIQSDVRETGRCASAQCLQPSTIIVKNQFKRHKNDIEWMGNWRFSAHGLISLIRHHFSPKISPIQHMVT